MNNGSLKAFGNTEGFLMNFFADFRKGSKKKSAQTELRRIPFFKKQ